jgi:Bacterial Ig-like domain (group 3)
LATAALAGSLAGAAQGATPPAVVTEPAVHGTAQVGQSLTYTSGTWNPASTVVDQWWSCTATTCAQIPGTTNNQTSYTVQSTDIGATIEISEVANDATVGDPSGSATSTPTATVTPPPPGFVAAPTISGIAQAGQTLTEVAAKWSNSPTSTAIQWYRCDSNNLNCNPIPAPAGTAKTYTLTDTDVGATMQVWETATNAGGSATNYSGFTGAVTNANQIVPAPNVAAGSSPGISGSAQLGRTLTASGAQFSGFPGTFSYQWLRCNALGCTAIPGATDVTYTPTTADVGDSVVFSETASNSGGASGAVLSSRTDTITAPSTTAVQTNVSAPVAGQTVTLIATVTSAAGSLKPAGTVDLHDGSAAIPGCTGLALGNAAPTAVCQTSFRASVANVSAVYSAAQGTFITGSTSSPTTLIVGRAETSVTVAAAAHVSLGNKTTYTATVHPPAGSTLTPTGRVTFTDSGKSIKGCGRKALAAHGAPCSVKYLGLKQHRIAAHYSGDANFAPSASITSHVLVQPQAPSGFVAVFMNWSFKFNLHATRIALLDATGLSAGIHIAVTCRGAGCPFAHRAITVSARGKCGKHARSGCVAAPSFNLASIFHRAHLGVGTRVAVAVTHRGWVGKYYRFTIRKGHKPSIDVSCLAVNGTRPGVGCSAR